MKSFKEYLIESQDEKKYVFKVKVAGELPDHCEDAMQASLQKFNVSKFAKGKTSPIQAKLIDFPNLQNESITMFDVEVDYPTTSQVVLAAISENTGIPTDRIKVRTTLEEEEAERNVENCEDDKKKTALLSQPYQKENNQSLVGDKKVGSFLKDLAKARKDTGMTQYKGVNDAILAKSTPKGKPQ